MLMASPIASDGHVNSYDKMLYSDSVGSGEGRVWPWLPVFSPMFTQGLALCYC